MQQIVFDRLIEICPECACFKDFIVEKKEDNWGRKLGGLSTKQRNHGFLDPKYEKQSASWKSSGGQIGTRRWHTRMKNEQPQQYRQMQYDRIKHSLKYKHEYGGQKYRNVLELEAAKILIEKSVDFEYERLLKCDDKFYFPDFAFDKIIVECTFWDDVEQKSRGLQLKVDDYLKLGFELVLIVTLKNI